MNFLIGRLSRFQHLSDETISRLIAGELATVRAFSSRSHIEKCWQCRSRREAFERAAMQVTEHRNRLVEGTPPNPQRRELLLADLRRRAEQSAPQPIWTRSISYLRSLLEVAVGSQETQVKRARRRSATAGWPGGAATAGEGDIWSRQL